MNEWLDRWTCVRVLHVCMSIEGGKGLSHTVRVALIRTEYVIPVPKSLPSSLGVATIKHQKHHIHTYRQVRVEVTAWGSWGTWEEPTVVNSVAHCLQHNVKHPLETKLGNFHPPVFPQHLRLLELNLLKTTTLLHVIIITLGELKGLEQLKD